MPGITEDQILLKLVIQGQSPDEIHRLAAQTQGKLNDEMKVLIDHLTQLHRDAAREQSAEDAAKTKKMMDNAEKQISVVNQVMRANEAAAAKTTTAWKEALEVSKNMIITARGMYDVITGGLGRLKALGDEIDRLTNVYGALRGSIDEMRTASKGEISDYDLITTKNRAFEKELELTDKQLGAVAAAADNFADSLGLNTKEALDSLIDGLANGKIKMLQHAGVVIDAETAYKKYAAQIGVAGDQLSDHGKKIAIVRESLRAMDEKLAKSGNTVDDFSHRYEQMTASLKNSTDQLLLFFGEVAVAIFELFDTTIPRAIRHAAATIQDSLGTNGILGSAIKSIPGVGGLLGVAIGNGATNNLDREKAFDAIQDKIKADAVSKNARDAAARLKEGTSYDYQKGSVRDSINQKKVESDAKAAEAEALRRQKSADSLDAMFRKGSGIGAASLGEEATVHQFESPAGLTAALGAPNTFAMTETIRKAQMAKQEADEKDQFRQAQEAAEAMAKLNEDTANEMMDKADKLRERAGNGIFATLLFGPSGREELIDDIDAFKNTAADAMGMVADTAMKMADALGQSLAAFVSGDKNKKKSIRDTTHDILEALAAQAYARAIFETAEGLASLALGPIGGVSAGMHFAAAGMFAAVGTAAGVGARAIGQSAGQTQEQKFQAQHDSAAAKQQFNESHGYSTSSGSSSSGFGSGGMRSSGGSGGDQQVNIYVNSPLGDRAEIGRGINLALAEYFAQSGRGVNVSQGSV